jgi:hydroxyethylthiazole kinase-like uncharacterized protein yjeF
MRGAWRVADVRATEESVMAGLPPHTLMRRAAEGLARRCVQLLGRAYGRRVLLLVGGGNNGGDALFAGASLAGRGAAVRAVLLAPEKVHAVGLAALLAAGGRVADLGESTSDGADLVIDGIVGIGATGPLRGTAADAVRALSAMQPRPLVVAVDVPSGVDVDTGAVPGLAVRADVTVTFGLLKPAHVVGHGAQLSGLLDVVDIGLSTPDMQPLAWVPDRDDVAAWWPLPEPDSDKYTRGVAGVATGSPDYPGAALLSASGALAGPAGMVRYAGPVAADVVRTHPSVVTSPDVASAGRVQAWLVGCGSGTSDRALGEVVAVLGTDLPAVVDADGLTLAATPAVQRVLMERTAPTVVTPHDREFERLGGVPVGPDRIASAQSMAARLGVTVLLKGDRTVVAGPDGAVTVNPTGTAALATAGTGDVLAGLIVSLLAGGLAPERAALAAAYVHGLAARHAVQNGESGGTPSAERTGQRRGRPVTAPDVAAALPTVIGSLLQGY